MFGILCWAWSTAMLHKASPVATAVEEVPIVAGTVVDQSTNMALGQALISVDGQSSNAVSEDNGNFRVVLPKKTEGPVRLTVTKDGYVKLDQSVTPPTHALILQMRPK